MDGTVGSIKGFCASSNHPILPESARIYQKTVPEAKCFYVFMVFVCPGTTQTKQRKVKLDRSSQTSKKELK